METKTTLRDLLKKYTINELWYILVNDREYIRNPIKAEIHYDVFADICERLLSLPTDENPKGILNCELRIDEDDLIDNFCNIGFDPTITVWEADKDGDTDFALDFIDWGELIDCEINAEHLSKYGGLIVCAELIKELSWHTHDNYSDSGRPNLEERLENYLEHCDDEDFIADNEAFEQEMQADLKKYREELAELSLVAEEWFLSAPECVKQRVLELLKGHSYSGVSDEDFITRLKEYVEYAAYEDKGIEKFDDLLRRMINPLDFDAMLYLAELLTGGHSS